MKIIFSKFQILIVFALLTSGCSTLQLSSVSETEKRNYEKAISDAAVIEKAEIVPLPVIDKKKKNIRVVTWTKYHSSYPVGKETTLKWGEVWVTLDKDIKSKCRNFYKKTLTHDLQKLLGLPLDSSGKRSFVVLEVDADSLFRPCANPSLQARECSSRFPKDVSPEHISWYAHHSALSYKFEKGYPWTRLGYTYNWKLGADEVGVAEFVVKKGSKAEVLSVEDSISYCKQ